MITLVVSIVGWVVFLSGSSPTSIAVAVLATLVTIPVRALVVRINLPAVFGLFLTAAILSLVPTLALAAALPLEVGPAVVGALFVHLPGLAVVSSVIDGLSGAPISAVARGLGAVVSAAALALGMLAGSALGSGLGLDYEPGTSVPLWVSTLGAALGMAGLAASWGIPRRALLPTLILGCAGWLAVALTPGAGLAARWAPVLLAATVVGVAGSAVAECLALRATPRGAADVLADRPSPDCSVRNPCRRRTRGRPNARRMLVTLGLERLPRVPEHYPGSGWPCPQPGCDPVSEGDAGDGPAPTPANPRTTPMREGAGPCARADPHQTKESNMSTESAVAGSDSTGAREQMSVADFKAMLDAGVPIDLVRQLKRRFAYRHFTPDAPDGQQTAQPDALYYFNFMWEFLPSAVVPAAPTTFDLPRALDPSFDEVTFHDLGGKAHPTFKEFIVAPDSKVQGVLMIHRGKVVYETYPGMRPTDKHLWMSCTKPLPGTLALDLVLAQKMDPNAPITEYVPELKASAWDGVPLQAVLTMTTGLNADDMSGAMYESGTMEQRYYMASFGDLYEGKKENWLDVIREAKKIAEPYALYQYASMNAQVLSVAVENVTGRKFVDHLYERLFQHAGTQELVANLFPDGSIHAATAMNSTLEDMARFGLLFTPTVREITGEEVIPPALVEHMFATKVPFDIYDRSFMGRAARDELGDQKVSGSGSQFDFLWDDGAFAKLGHNNQGLYIDPAREFVGVYFSASTLPNYPIGYMRAAARLLP